MFIAYIAFGLVKCIIVTYTWLTYPIYALCFCGARSPVAEAAKVKVKIVERSKTDVTFKSTGHSCPRRDEILNNPEKIDTVAKMFSYIVKKFGNRQALGTRKAIREEEEKQADGKVFSKLILGDYAWLTYNDVKAHATNFGKGIRELGVKPRAKVCIFSDTRSEWLISATGCFGSSIALCTIYTNLGEDGIVHGIVQTDVSTIITSSDLYPKLVAIRDRIPHVKQVIYFESPVRPRPEPIQGFSLHPFSEVLALGAKSSLPPTPPVPEDTAIIMYTSGSTGTPKGVILSHKNMVSGMLSLLTCVSDAVEADGPAKADDCYIAFLPLAHVLEMLAEHIMLILGVKLGYSSPNTLTDKSTMIKTGEKGDASVLKPTVMASVPLIIDRIYKGIKNTISEKSGFAQLLVGYCFEYREYWTKKGYTTPMMDCLIFGKMKAVIGGRMRMMLCGGAPLAEDAQSFIRTAITCTLLQGYGLTETCSTATIGDPKDLTTGQVGPPLLGVFLRLEDWDEGGYTVHDTVGPRGEIIIGGDHVSMGYYNMPEKTAEDFFNENGVQFFRTGDIGQVLPNGAVKIIDRKKDLVKMQAGEYVSLGKVESNLKINPLIENICVYGDSRHTATVALIVPDNDKLTKLAEGLGKKNKSREELCKDPGVVKAVLEEMNKQAKSVRLEKFEIPKQIYLVAEQWTPETGMVTAAFKLRRKPIQEKFQKQLDALYAKMGQEGAELINMKGS